MSALDEFDKILIAEIKKGIPADPKNDFCAQWDDAAMREVIQVVDKLVERIEKQNSKIQCADCGSLLARF